MCARPPHRSVHSRRPDIDRARQSLSACAPVSCFSPPSSFHPRRVDRARDLRASLASRRRGSLHSHYRAAASPSRRPSHGLPCMPCRLTFCARVVCRRSLHRRASSAGSCWTLPDTNLDAPAPRVAAGAAPRARVARPRCDALRARCGLMATWSAAGVGERRTLATLRLSWTLLVLGSRVGRSEDRWRECRERFTCVLVK